VKEPAKKNMYKSISAAYTVIVLSYWQLALCGYWDFGSQVQPYILASLSIPKWTVEFICSYSNMWMLSGRVSFTSILFYLCLCIELLVAIIVMECKRYV
jgi:hypothetical protein